MSGLEENVRHISEAHKENMQAEDLFQKQLEEAKKTSAVRFPASCCAVPFHSRRSSRKFCNF